MIGKKIQFWLKKIQKEDVATVLKRNDLLEIELNRIKENVKIKDEEMKNIHISMIGT